MDHVLQVPHGLQFIFFLQFENGGVEGEKEKRKNKKGEDKIFDLDHVSIITYDEYEFSDLEVRLVR